MFESLRKSNPFNLAKQLRLWLSDKSIWVGAAVVGIVVAYIEVGRQLSVAVPIPFLILLGIVALVASIGGKRPGLAGAMVASAFIFYSMLINFGPATLTGGPFQALLGISLMLLVGYFLGRTRDQNQYLIAELESTYIDLERRVAKRTAEFSAINEQLTQEIQERIQAEESLRSNEIYFRSLIENALDIVTVLNEDGTIRYESPSVERVLGYDPEELIGRSVFDFIYPDDVERVRRNYTEWKKIGGRSRVLEFRFRAKDGSWRVLEVIGNNLLDNPSVAGAVINSRDITRRLEMEKQVQRQEQLALVGQLAAGIAHDFNNVMAVILLYAQLLNRSPNLTDKQRKQLKTIYNEGQRAADLTAQILDFARQSVLDRRPLDLLPFLGDFVELLQRTLADNIEILFEHDGDGYVVTADSSRIQQALMNLALNSRDAMPGGGRILIQLIRLEFEVGEEAPVPGAAGEWVRIRISDNGSGISAEGQNHLFEPFYTTKEPGKGTGLGLAQVYGIVKQHNGFVSVESELGKGTTIAITLPAAIEGEPNNNRQIPDLVTMGNGQVLLVVEDNNATRLALMSALETLNYTVKGAVNGLEALTLLRRHQDEIVLVLSDVVMPEMGGVALLNAMAREEISIPAVLVTGNSTTEELELVKAEGRVDWYSKPIPLQQLAEIVASKIGGS